MQFLHMDLDQNTEKWLLFRFLPNNLVHLMNTKITKHPQYSHSFFCKMYYGFEGKYLGSYTENLSALYLSFKNICGTEGLPEYQASSSFSSFQAPLGRRKNQYPMVDIISF